MEKENNGKQYCAFNRWIFLIDYSFKFLLMNRSKSSFWRYYNTIRRFFLYLFFLRWILFKNWSLMYKYIGHIYLNKKGRKKHRIFLFKQPNIKWTIRLMKMANESCPSYLVCLSSNRQKKHYKFYIAYK